MANPSQGEDRRLHPPVFEIAGDSMEPSLWRGWRVRAGPLSADPRPGEIVVIQTRSGPLIHRVLCSARHRDGGWVFHRGDGGGRIGQSPAAAVVGCVEAILVPPGTQLPPVDLLPWRLRQAFRWARARAWLYAACRLTAHALGFRATSAARLGGRLLRWLLR